MAKGNGVKANGRGSRKRRGKGEDDTGAKDAKAEMRKAKVVAELDLPKADDVLFHMKSIRGYKEIVTSAQGKLRNAIKSAKKCNPLLPEVINELLALERADDPTEFKRRMEALGEGLKAVGSPYQLTLHDTLLGSAEDAADKRGYTDGKAGRAMSNPYPEGTQFADLYAQGYMRAQAEIITGMGHNSTAAGDEPGEFAEVVEPSTQEPELAA